LLAGAFQAVRGQRYGAQVGLQLLLHEDPTRTTLPGWPPGCEFGVACCACLAIHQGWTHAAVGGVLSLSYVLRLCELGTACMQAGATSISLGWTRLKCCVRTARPARIYDLK
jgi:hypothetical protein